VVAFLRGCHFWIAIFLVSIALVVGPPGNANESTQTRNNLQLLLSLGLGLVSRSKKFKEEGPLVLCNRHGSLLG
jgi:hypothetical protein